MNPSVIFIKPQNLIPRILSVLKYVVLQSNLSTSLHGVSQMKEGNECSDDDDDEIIQRPACLELCPLNSKSWILLFNTNDGIS